MCTNWLQFSPLMNVLVVVAKVSPYCRKTEVMMQAAALTGQRSGSEVRLWKMVSSFLSFLVEAKVIGRFLVNEMQLLSQGIVSAFKMILNF